MWRGYGPGSGDQVPTPEELERWHRRTSPPDNELPAGVGITALLAATPDAAVGLTQVEAFSTGFRFTLAVRLRQPRPDLDVVPGGLMMLVDSRFPVGPRIPAGSRLLLGIEYPDGRRGSTLDDDLLPPAAEVADGRLVFTGQGGSGSDQSVDQAFWVAPLPPDGPVTVVLAWPVLGIEESRTVLDGAAITTAAARSQVLWPPQPPDRRPPVPPPTPRPSSGWFAQPPD